MYKNLIMTSVAAFLLMTAPHRACAQTQKSAKKATTTKVATQPAKKTTTAKPAARQVKKTATASPATPKVFVLADGKLGPIKKGAAASTFPKQVEGLYDKFETKKEEFYDNEETYTVEYILFTKVGKPVFRANIDEGKVAFITLLEGSSNTKTPDGIYVGYNARELFKRKKWNGKPIMKGMCSPATAHTPIPSLLMTSLTQTSLKKPPTSSRTQKSPKSHTYHKRPPIHYI